MMMAANSKTRRSARATGVWLLLLSLAIVASAALFLSKDPAAGPDGGPVVVFCGAGVAAPVQAAARRYESEYGVPIRLQMGSSQALLAQARVTGQADLFIPGDDSFIDLARRDGLVWEAFPLARMRVVLAVRAGNPKRIHSIADLLKPETKLGQADPDVAAVGRLAREALQRSNAWERLKPGTAAFMGTVNEVVNSLRLGAIDAGFVWDVLLIDQPGLEAVSVPEFEGVRAHVTVGVLVGSSRAARARHFAGYLAASDRGIAEFRAAGFEPVEEGAWDGAPLPY